MASIFISKHAVDLAIYNNFMRIELIDFRFFGMTLKNATQIIYKSRSKMDLKNLNFFKNHPNIMCDRGTEAIKYTIDLAFKGSNF